jgi:thymidylate synthase
MKEIIEELENELNQLGSNWNLFGKVDKMKYLVKKLKEITNERRI